MERSILCILLAVAMTATVASATYSRTPFMRTGYGWGYGLGHPVARMGLHFGGGIGVGRAGFALPVSPISLGYAYRPHHYNHYNHGVGHGYGYGYGSRRYSPRYHSRYSMGGYGTYFPYDDDRRYWPYSGIDDWDLDGSIF